MFSLVCDRSLLTRGSKKLAAIPFSIFLASVARTQRAIRVIWSIPRELKDLQSADKRQQPRGLPNRNMIDTRYFTID